jgi:hypothetical protein
LRSSKAAWVLVAGCACGPACTVGDSREATATSVAAITNGSSDTGDDAVVAVVGSSGVTACTGTVVAPHIVLTAAHCLVPEVLQGGNVLVGTAAASPSATLPIARGIAHPQFDPTALTNDVGILVLAAAAPPPPIPFGTAPPAVGDSVDLVGWGESAADAGDFGEKRKGTGTVAQVDADTFGVGSTPSQPCEGDSGGPAFVTASGVTSVEGITSHGDAACVAGATYTRVDAYVASFISPTMAQYAAGSASSGTTCLFPEQCADGASACVVAPDDPSLSYCAGPCQKSSDCPASMACQTVDGAQQCRYPLPTPGAYGAPCSGTADCVEGECTTTGVCAERCDPAAPSCPGTSTCTNTSGIDFFCIFPPPPAAKKGGCAVVEGSPRPAFPAWLAGGVVAIVCARRRARRR